jgi:hypothetical protein
MKLLGDDSKSPSIGRRKRHRVSNNGSSDNRTATILVHTPECYLSNVDSTYLLRGVESWNPLSTTVVRILPPIYHSSTAACATKPIHALAIVTDELMRDSSKLVPTFAVSTFFPESAFSPDDSPRPIASRRQSF